MTTETKPRPADFQLTDVEPAPREAPSKSKRPKRRAKKRDPRQLELPLEPAGGSDEP